MLQTIPSVNKSSLWTTLIEVRPFFLWPLFKLEILSAETKKMCVPLKLLALLLCLKESLIEDIKHTLNGTFSFVSDMPISILLHNIASALTCSWVPKIHLKHILKSIFFQISANALNGQNLYNGKIGFTPSFEYSLQDLKCTFLSS